MRFDELVITSSWALVRIACECRYECERLLLQSALALEEAGVFRAAGVSAGALYRALVYNALRRRVAEEVEEAAAAAAAARLEQQHQQHETPARPRHVRPAPSWAEEIDIFIPEICSEEDEQVEAALAALQRADEDDEMEEDEDVEWGT